MSSRLREAVEVYCKSCQVANTLPKQDGVRMLEALAGNVEYKRQHERMINDQLAEAASWIIKTANTKSRVEEFRFTSLVGAAEMAAQCLEVAK